jgi:hypothetical protein
MKKAADAAFFLTWLHAWQPALRMGALESRAQKRPHQAAFSGDKSTISADEP